MNKFSGIMNKVGFVLRRKSPELLIAGSIIAAAGSIIMAVKATPKAQQIVADANRKIANVKEKMDDIDALKAEEYTIQDCKKELTKVYAKTALNIGYNYLPTALGFTLTVAGILGSHKIMKGRNVALAAAYTTLENGYKSYRSRVAAKVGDAVEKDIFRNVYSENKEVTVINEDGTETTTTQNVTGAHLQIDCDFTALYDYTAREWQRDTSMNLNLLQMKERYLNEKLRINGALFLHEVYDELGLDIHSLGDTKAQASRVLGWIYDPSDNTRDSYISIGLFDQMGNKNEYAMNALRNNEQDLFLEFNVDGDILTGTNGKRTFMKNRRVV